MTQPKVAIAITADDKTARGAKSAEKRLGAIPKHTSSVVRRGLGDLSRQGSSAIRTLGAVEQATARVFGNSSVTSGLASRLGAVRAAGAAAGTGMGEAATAGGALTTVIGAVGTAAAATVGVLAAAAYGAFKLADGWAKGAASIGRTAMIIGVAKKEMQEFSAAAERMGVDRGAATAGLGSLSQTLNDARYGRNAGAMAVLTKMGVKLQERSDGTVNVEAMLPAIADAIARQNSSGRRTAAHALGLSDELIPVLAQGGKALGADMKDAGRTAYIASDGDVALGTRIARKGAMVGQMVDKGQALLGRGAAETAEPGYDMALSAGRQMVGGATTFGGVVRNTFAPAAAAIERGARSIERASSAGGGGLRGGVLKMSPKDVVDLKKTAATEWNGRSTSQLYGVVDTILNRQASGRWGRTVADVVNAKKQFSDVNGPVAWSQGRHSVDAIPSSRVSPRLSAMVDSYLAARERGRPSSIGDHLNYANPNGSSRRNQGWISRLDGPTLGSGTSIHRHGTTPDLQRSRPGAFAVDAPIPIRVEIEMRGAPAGTSAKVSAGRGAPAISQAWAMRQ